MPASRARLDLVVALSGASSGLGLAAARGLTALGCRVVGGARRFPAPGIGFDNERLDVRDADSVRAFVDAVVARHGRIDALVNCAGVALTGPLEHTRDAEERAMFDVNVLGMMRLCRAALPQLRQRPGSRIVNVSSLAGFIGIPFHTAYCATKFAVEGFSEALQYELRPFGVHVSVLQPGDFLTEMTERYLTVEDAADGPAYQAALQRATALMEADCRKGVDLAPFTKALAAALRARRPRLRYIAALPGQALAAKAARIAPDAAVSTVVRRMYEQP